MACPCHSVAMSMIHRQSVWSLAILQAEWIPMLADCTLASIPVIQFVSISGCPPGLLQWNNGWSNTLMTRWCSCKEFARDVPEEVKLYLLSKRRNWTATGCLHDSGYGYMSSIQDLKHFTEWPCIKGMQLPSKSFTTIHASDPHVSTGRTYDVYKLTLSTLRRQQCNVSTLHYIRFFKVAQETTSRSNVMRKTTTQYLDMIAKKDVFLVCVESLTVTRWLWCCLGDYSRVSNWLRWTNASRRWHDVAADHKLIGGWRAETTLRQNVSNTIHHVGEVSQCSAA